MKVILYMAMSLNGMIAKEDDGTSWVSETEWRSYSNAVKNAGCLIVGRRTYHILTRQPEFDELKNVQLIAVSKKPFETIAENHLIATSPKEALEKLKEFETVVVAGGGILNSAFLKDDLVDEIFVDIEPTILGKGIKLFDDDDFEASLELLGTQQLSPSEIQLHYNVIK